MNIYEVITDRIIAQLEKGEIPWKKPWFGVQDGAYRAKAKQPYSFLNQILLGKQGAWASFKEWNEMGCTIKKGEKSSIVTFWKVNVIEEVKDDGQKAKKVIPILRYYNVFHESQVEKGDKCKFHPITQDEMIDHSNDGNGNAERMVNEYVTREGITLRETESNQAFYRPSTDEVIVPLRNQFREMSEFYSTLFHEIVHSTGAKGRLNRIKADKFGSESYSKEELVAEMGATCLCNQFGIETRESFENSSAYIQNWLKVLRDDKRFIVSASSQAEKAINYIKGEVKAKKGTEDKEDKEEAKETA